MRRRTVCRSGNSGGDTATVVKESTTSTTSCGTFSCSAIGSLAVVKDNWGTILLGICLRLFAYHYLSDDLSQRPEWTTNGVSVRRLRDGVAMRRDGIEPYSGDSFHVLPIYMAFFDKIIDVDNKWRMLAFHVVLDTLTGVLLSLAANLYAEENERADRQDLVRNVGKFYLLNPLAIGSCALLNMTTVYNFALALVVYFFCAGCVLMSSLFLSVSIVSQAYPVTLVASLFLRFSTAGQRIQLFTVVPVGCAVLTLANYWICGSWDFVEDTYMYTFRIDDLTPNSGIFWYFFTQMFETFRSFYVAVAQGNALIYVLPLTLSLRNDSFLHLVISLLLLAVFSAYPTLADAAPYMALLPLLDRYSKYQRYFLVIGCTVFACVVLMPVMWHMWILSGSGNANFYFGVTLFYNLAQVYLLMDLIYAYYRTDGDLHYGKDCVTEKTRFVLY